MTRYDRELSIAAPTGFNVESVRIGARGRRVFCRLYRTETGRVIGGITAQRTQADVWRLRVEATGAVTDYRGFDDALAALLELVAAPVEPCR